MRVATEEEDVLLQKISNLQREIYDLENELMLCESMEKGYKEKRRQLTVRFFSVNIVCAFLMIMSAGFLIRIGNDWRLTIALFLGSGGLGLFAAGFLIYTIIHNFRYWAQVSSSDTFIDIAHRSGIDNLYSLSIGNNTKINNHKSNIRKYNEELDEALKEYFALKEKNDKQFEADVASGKIKPGFNFDAYNSFVEVTNEMITLNKLRVEHLKVTNKRKNIEKDVENMIQYEDDCRKSIIWSMVLLFVLIGTIIAMVIFSIFEKDVIMYLMIRLAITALIMITGFVGIVNFVNFIFKFPFLSDSEMASFLADKFGFEKTKKDRDSMMIQIDSCNSRLKELNAEIEITKKILSDSKDESVMS